LAATLNDTTPFALPVAPAVIVIQGALLLAVQLQPAFAITLTVPGPPAAATF
jgi:hypothetical protein